MPQASVQVLAASYGIALALAELLTRVVQPGLGLALFCIVALVALAHAAAASPDTRALLLALAVVAIVRILALGMPLGVLSRSLAQLAVALPCAVAIGLALRAAGYLWRDIGLVLTTRDALLSLALLPVGLAAGLAAYPILLAPPAVARPDLQPVLAAVVVLALSTGLVEELLYRGLLLRSTIQALGPVAGAGYSIVVFAVLAADPWALPVLALSVTLGVGTTLMTIATGSVIPAVATRTAFNVAVFVVSPLVLAP